MAAMNTPSTAATANILWRIDTRANQRPNENPARTTLPSRIASPAAVPSRNAR